MRLTGAGNIISTNNTKTRKIYLILYFIQLPGHRDIYHCEYNIIQKYIKIIIHTKTSSAVWTECYNTSVAIVRPQIPSETSIIVIQKWDR